MSVTNWENKPVDFVVDSPEFQEMYAEAHNGNMVAQYGLGKWYDSRGQKEEAAYWYRQAEAQGHEGAAEALAEITA